MKFAIIKERKNPPDKRAVLSPNAADELQQMFPQARVIVESDTNRTFSDQEYRQKGVEVKDQIEDCDVFLGVKEVPVEALIPNKKYFFFSHTIKKQPYNRKLLKAILEKNIELYDHEVITYPNGVRVVAFGRYAGIVGAYNSLRTLGLKTKSYVLPRANLLKDQAELITELNKISFPKVKIVLTGKGRVGNAAKEILAAASIKEVAPEDFLNKDFDGAVFTQIDVLDYNKRKDGKVLNMQDFFDHPEQYDSDFMKFAKVSDVFIAGHFYGDGAPYLFTREDARRPDFKIKVVGDISCDIDGPVASTLRACTIADPNYGYDPKTESEVDFMQAGAIAVMAVDTLPSELPRDASEGFGESFLKEVIPAFFNGDKDGILQRAQMTKNGKLTEKFKYLQKYVDGIE
ncbi:NAD(P)-dependent oxidoreductase [Namhaeicola litoreus]|uniref:Saccharopine dehydrogenase [NAD(+), L-lysine-forming] n=1 Tax=Namhaeicola litoreus TaxID=1052145 RepID=A0ABW3Y178_9FLAO